MVKYNLIINCLPHFYHVQSQNINFHIPTKNGIDVTENVYKNLWDLIMIFRCKNKVNEIGYDSLMFHKPGKEPTILKSNDYLPIIYLIIMGFFFFVFPPLRKISKKI